MQNIILIQTNQKNNSNMKSCYLILLLIALASCNTKPTAVRETIDLSGIWHFDIDTADIGIQQNWFLSDLKDSVKLPGTTDLNKKGFLNTDTITLHLSRVYKYEGAAWYRKKVVIPESFRNKHVLLSLERTKCSMIWIDSCYVGSSRILQSPQQFNLSDFLTPGDHFITIRIDNSLKQTPYGNVHIYSDDTQTNWNGIIGKLSVESSAKTYITNLQVYPDIENKKILIRLEIEDRLNLKEVNINLRVAKIAYGKVKKLRPKKMTLAVEPVLELEYNLGKDCSLWDEYKTPVYSLTAEISNGEIKDSKTVPFGMRKYTISGTQFNINGRTVFLRGKNDAAVFPLTGHVPMDAKEWTKVFTIARSYGINHYRYHSYCPPEAAFTAADRVGIYIQAELPFWGGLDSDSLAEQLREEGFAMLKAYANHPSFVMF
jgi:beta-galactosidase/beta-glucuronidase